MRRAGAFFSPKESILNLASMLVDMTELNEDEKRFVDSVRDVVTEFLETRTEKDIDNGIGSFVLSDSGSVYHGVPVGAARWTHGEENAIGNMVTQEGVSSRIEMILIVGGDESICMPCGICRTWIYKFGTEDTSILAGNQKLTKVEKFTISDLYPYPYTGEF
jgi:cytidine deaminase